MFCCSFSSAFSPFKYRILFGLRLLFCVVFSSFSLSFFQCKCFISTVGFVVVLSRLCCVIACSEVQRLFHSFRVYIMALNSWLLHSKFIFANFFLFPFLSHFIATFFAFPCNLLNCILPCSYFPFPSSV